MDENNNKLQSLCPCLPPCFHCVSVSVRRYVIACYMTCADGSSTLLWLGAARQSLIGLAFRQQPAIATSCLGRTSGQHPNTYHYLIVLCLDWAGHLDDGHAEVAANPEGDEEPDRR